jgi:hypothetical protein
VEDLGVVARGRADEHRVDLGLPQQRGGVGIGVLEAELVLESLTMRLDGIGDGDEADAARVGRVRDLAQYDGVGAADESGADEADVEGISQLSSLLL